MNLKRDFDIIDLQENEKMNKWTKEHEQELELYIEDGLRYAQIAELLNEEFGTARTAVAVKTKALRLGLKGSSRKHTTEQYKAALPNDIELLEEYVNDKTKILHRHSCGHEWLARPSDIKQGKSCPVCANNGFDQIKTGFTYLIYFKKLDLYKIGKTGNMVKRFKHFGHKPELIFYREFKLGSDAGLLERQWLENIKHLKVNTGKLKSGNGETFYINII